MDQSELFSVYEFVQFVNPLIITIYCYLVQAKIEMYV